MNRLRIFFVLSVLVVACSLTCCSNKHAIRDKIALMKSSKIDICLDSMMCVTKSTDIDENLSKPFRLIVFVDSSSCSLCEIRKIWKWEAFLKEKERSNFIGLFVILETNRKKMADIKETLESDGISCPVYLDYKFSFLRNNPHVPNNHLFHSFLLDKNDSVILIGEPIQNKTIENLYDKKINELG